MTVRVNQPDVAGRIGSPWEWVSSLDVVPVA
jgi:hypothetical protein